MGGSSWATRRIGLTLALLAVQAAAVSAEVWRRPLWVENGAAVIDVWTSGRGPYRFLVDTGAEGTTLSRELAATLALAPIGAVEQHTVSGVIRMPMVRLAELRLGREGPLVAGLAVAVSDLQTARRSLPALDGVLGGDVLAAFDYVLDYRAGRLVLARGETLALRGGVALPLHPDRRRPVVSWPRRGGTAGDHDSLLLVVDSGADSLIVDATTTFACRREARLMATLDTHAGGRAVQVCEAESLQAGDLTIDGLRLIAIDWPTSIPRVERGLLPASAFGRVYVSAARGTVTFWAR